MDDLLRDALRLDYVLFFQNEIACDRLSDIRKLYDAAHITNDMLVRQLHEHTDVLVDLDKCVFNDIATILARKVTEKEELAACFDALYSRYYRKSYAAYDKIRTVVLEDPDGGTERARKMLQPMLRSAAVMAPEEEGSREEDLGAESLMLILCTRDPVFTGSGIIGKDMLLAGASGWKRWTGGTNEHFINEDQYFFTDVHEKIFPSKMYAKFVKKTKEGIASFLGTTADQLESRIRAELDLQLDSTDFHSEKKQTEGSVASMAALEVYQNHYGSSHWFRNMITPKGHGRGNLGYRPDLDRLLDAYCRARVQNGYRYCLLNGHSFTKADLLRECRAENPKEDYLALLYLCQMDIVSRMAEHVMELYYRNFSWDAISGQSPLTRANQMIGELEAALSEKDRRIADQSRRIEAMRAAKNQSADAGRIALQRENERLLDTIDEKDREIAELKEKIRYQEELSEASEQEAEAPEDVTVDLSALQKKWYLFVGHTEDDFPELDHTLKKYFPDSIYMESTTDAIDQVRVDAVVFLIKWLSHAMYYKARSSAALKGVPVIFCNTRNIDRILQEMQEGVTQ